MRKALNVPGLQCHLSGVELIELSFKISVGIIVIYVKHLAQCLAHICCSQNGARHCMDLRCQSI